MRVLSAAVTITLLISSFAAAEETVPQPPRDPRMAAAFGPLPREGDVNDILRCSAANEVLWAKLMKEDPRDKAALDAKHKAGWYAAVALWIFEVDETAITDAISQASDPARLDEVTEQALQCRHAPPNWKE